MIHFAAFIGVGAAVGGTVWLSYTPEWEPVNAGASRFFGWGLSGFLFSGVVMTLTHPFVVFPFRWAKYIWPVWLTVRYWIFIQSPHTVTAAYYEIEQALAHLKDKDPDQAKLCLTRALTGVAPAYDGLPQGAKK